MNSFKKITVNIKALDKDALKKIEDEEKRRNELIEKEFEDWKESRNLNRLISSEEDDDKFVPTKFDEIDIEKYVTAKEADIYIEHIVMVNNASNLNECTVTFANCIDDKVTVLMSKEELNKLIDSKIKE